MLSRWGPVRDRLLSLLGGLGYTVGMHLLDARAYGVPQARQRVFFIGTAADLTQRLAALDAAGFSQVVFSIPSGQEHAIEDWGRIRRAFR